MRNFKSVNIRRGNDGVLSANVKKYDINALLDKAYGPGKWVNHLENDLMKFWKTEDAENFQGKLFPTYRGNDGKLFDKNDPPPEIKAAMNDPATSGLIDLDNNYIRAHSRQTYAYGIAFHMTGNTDYLKLCKKGADALAGAINGNYGMYTKCDHEGKWADPDYRMRTSQDLAYGLTGLGMYYFLTRDNSVLYDVLRLKDFIFTAYFDESKGYLTWFPKNNDDNDVEIVAQLDQLYAYMLMLTPVLPEPYQSIWKKDLKKIADVIIQYFYSERYGFFWGVDSSSKYLSLGTDHTDFGHSVKTFWVILKIGELLDDIYYINFAKEHINKILEWAYIEENGSWARRFDENGETDNDKEWWILAELDQACEIMALNDPSYLSYLNNTQKYWFDYMVDKENGEIWHMVDGKTNQPVLNYPKIHNWKTSLHSFEHALFGYMTAAEFKNRGFDVFYALPEWQTPSAETAKPYMFRANINGVSVEKQYVDFLNDNNKVYRVSFNVLH